MIFEFNDAYVLFGMFQGFKKATPYGCAWKLRLSPPSVRCVKVLGNYSSRQKRYLHPSNMIDLYEFWQILMSHRISVNTWISISFLVNYQIYSCLLLHLILSGWFEMCTNYMSFNHFSLQVRCKITFLIEMWFKFWHDPFLFWIL